jgi:hypothetical protein
MAAAVDEDVPARRRPACIDRLDPWRRISARHARLPNSMAIPADHAQSRACARRSIGRGRTGSQLRGGDREAMRDVTRPVPNRRREGDNKSNRRVRSPAAADRSARSDRQTPPAAHGSDAPVDSVCQKLCWTYSSFLDTVLVVDEARGRRWAGIASGIRTGPIIAYLQRRQLFQRHPRRWRLRFVRGAVRPSKGWILA